MVILIVRAAFVDSAGGRIPIAFGGSGDFIVVVRTSDQPLLETDYSSGDAQIRAYFKVN